MRDGGGGEEGKRKGVDDKSLGLTEERLEGAEKGRRGPLGPLIVTRQPPFPQDCPPGAQLSTPSLQGEVGSPLSPFFSLQEGTGSRCHGWDIPWLCSLFPDSS